MSYVEKKTHNWKRCLEYIRENGLTQADAHKLAGIPQSTFYHRAKNDPDFQMELEAANAEFKRFHLEKINTADKWQASAWILERKFPEEFAQQQKIELNDVSDKLQAVADAVSQSDSSTTTVPE